MDSCLQYRMTNVDCDTRYCDFYLGTGRPGRVRLDLPEGRRPRERRDRRPALARSRSPRPRRRTSTSGSRRTPAYAKGKKIDVVGGGVSISPPLKQTVTDGLMLVGDAARMIDPLTGGGIANGCIAGKICGEVAAEGGPLGKRLDAGVLPGVREGLAGAARGEALPELAREGEALLALRRRRSTRSSTRSRASSSRSSPSTTS